MLLLRELQAVGVTLFIQDGRLAFDAPAGVMTDERLARLRADRDAVLAALQSIEQPVGPVPDSDEIPLGFNCPFCQCRRFDDEPRGMRCRDCSRLAWLFLADGSVVRVDYEKTDLRFDVERTIKGLGDTRALG